MTAVATVDETAFVIDCWKEKSMTWELAMISLKRETAARNLSMFGSQKGYKMARAL